MKFHHIGIACANIREEIESIRGLHDVTKVSPIIYDSEQNAELCMISTREGINIELISGPQVEKIIKKQISYYHLCYETDNIEADLEKLQDEGAFLVSDLKPAILFGNKKVAFLQVSYGLIELVQKTIS